MAALLRKVWESVSTRKNSTSSSSSSSSSSATVPFLGAFDPIPTELLMQIVRLVGPKGAARLRVVCKAWRSLVADNELWIFFWQTQQEEELHWESILFSDTHLRSGYHIQTLPQLPLMSIYGQRGGAIIIDGGSGYCKFGWGKDDYPAGRSATFLEFGNVESPMYSRLHHFFGTIYTRMQVKPYLQPVVVSVPICHYDDTESAKASRQQLKDSIYRVLFDMNVPAVCAINQASLALYAARRTSGIVVNIGFQVTSVVPILNGKVMRKVGVEVIGLGALKLTGFLRELMQQKNINFESLYTIRTIKEAVALCMDHCHSAELTGDDSWFKTVVLAGGSACLPGLAGRLEKELHGLLPPSVSNGITVIPPPFGADTAWFGAKIISNLSTFPGPWCVTKKQLRQKSKVKQW